ncbi:hypothetical protein HYPSUDRAFT_465809 [Hypholoma sublateritium FD-334 SS-4]|uniref:Uncharacterized protein n=1 Tax=Hypholoma sublateritium (strain FD-334 SS-4) TaxID=945553 RepID=A0A0D2LC42_HYPSF|nr:hypothetical protein HYPSUDRAFT_465809 [Hypholoma sublateritium FD-334 SS-4]
MGVCSCAPSESHALVLSHGEPHFSARVGEAGGVVGALGDYRPRRSYVFLLFFEKGSILKSFFPSSTVCVMSFRPFFTLRYGTQGRRSVSCCGIGTECRARVMPATRRWPGMDRVRRARGVPRKPSPAKRHIHAVSAARHSPLPSLRACIISCMPR